MLIMLDFFFFKKSNIFHFWEFHAWRWYLQHFYPSFSPSPVPRVSPPLTQVHDFLYLLLHACAVGWVHLVLLKCVFVTTSLSERSSLRKPGSPSQQTWTAYGSSCRTGAFQDFPHQLNCQEVLASPEWGESFPSHVSLTVFLSCPTMVYLCKSEGKPSG